MRHPPFWTAFILGPFWYWINGMHGKFIFLLLVCFFSLLLACPFIWVYCGFRAKRDFQNFRLRKNSEIDPETI